MTRQDRGGRLPESLMKVHSALLATQWQNLPTQDLWNHLYRVVGAEHQRHPKIIEGVRYFGDQRLQPQLRWRRLAVAKELCSRGVELHPQILEHALPHRAWPGLAVLMPRISRSHA